MANSRASTAIRGLSSSRFALLLVCVGVVLGSVAQAATITWTNASGGNWSDPANWSSSQVPGPGDDAVLPALSGAYSVTLDVDPVSNTLQIAAGDPTLDVAGRSLASVTQVTNSGAIVNLDGTYDSNQIRNQSGGTIDVAAGHSIQMTGVVWNDGTIRVGSTSTVQSPAGLTLSGSGTLALNQSEIYDPSGGSTLTILAGVSVIGSGIINKPVRNSGLIACDENQRVLRFDAIVWNTGTIRVSHQGTVNVNRPLAKNQGGTITSGSGGGTFTVMTASQVGGTLDCSPSVYPASAQGRIVADGGDLSLSAGTVMNAGIERVGSVGAVAVDIATFQDLTVASGAELSVPGHADFMAAGTSLTNNGTVRVAGSINFGIYAGQYNINLGGHGTVILEGGILGTGTGATLWNQSSQTIQGCGTINPPFLNDGTVNLDCGGQLKRAGSFVNRRVMRVMGGKLVVTGGATLTNRGRLSAARGPISVEKGGTIDNTGGVLTAVKDISLGDATTSGTVIGGRLEAETGGVFVVQKAATLRDVTLGTTASLVTSGGATTTITGTRFLNQGVERVAALGNLVVGPSTDYVQELPGSTTLQGGTLSSTRDLQIHGGTLSGFGTIVANVVSTGGTVRPEGALRIQGDYHQASNGGFKAVLGPAGSGSALDITGSATLDGALATSLATGFAPTPGDRMSVLSYGSVSGRFASFDGAIGNQELVVVPEYGDRTLDLVISGSLGAGDSPRTPAELRFYGRGGRSGASFVLELPYAADVKGGVFDVSGREVARLADGHYAAGVHTLAFGRAGTMGPSSGVYFARVALLSSGTSEVRTARVIVLH